MKRVDFAGQHGGARGGDSAGNHENGRVCNGTWLSANLKGLFEMGRLLLSTALVSLLSSGAWAVDLDMEDFDENGDDVVSRIELEDGASGVTDEIWDMYDLNDDEALDEDEFDRVVFSDGEDEDDTEEEDSDDGEDADESTLDAGEDGSDDESEDEAGEDEGDSEDGDAGGDDDGESEGDDDGESEADDDGGDDDDEGSISDDGGESSSEEDAT